jgi:hypothetical protein
MPAAMAGAVAAIAVLVVAVLALAASAASAAPKRTPLFVTVLTPPAPVVGSDGRQHLAYELTLENNTGTRAEVDSVAVRARGAGVLLRIAGAQLRAVMQNFGFVQTNAFAASEGGRMWLT